MVGKKGNGPPPGGTQPAKFKAPCKYYKYGTCRMGEHCRFLHLEADHPTKHPHLVKKPFKGKQAHHNSGSIERNQTAQQGSWSAVAAASSSALNATGSSSSTSHLLSVGTVEEIEDALVELSPEEGLLWKSLDVAAAQARLERLPFLHIIALEGAEVYASKVENLLRDHFCDVYLEVAKPSSKQGQSEVLARLIAESRADHLVVLAARNARNCSCQVKDGGRLAEVKVGAFVVKIWTSLAAMASSPAVGTTDLAKEGEWGSLSAYASVHHVGERLERLSADVEELTRPSSQAGKYWSDEKLAARLTKVQKVLIRFHKQATAVKARVEQSLTLNSDEAKCGTSRGPGFDPSPIRPLIPPSVCKEMHGTVENLWERLEALGEKLSSARATLWRGYLDATLERESDPSLPGASSKETWNCPACTYHNQSGAVKCAICETPMPAESEWAVTGSSSKKQRKRNQRKVNLVQESEQLEEEERRMQRIRVEQEQMQLRKQQQLLRSSAPSPVIRTVIQRPVSSKQSTNGSWSQQVGRQVSSGSWGASNATNEADADQYVETYPALGSDSSSEGGEPVPAVAAAGKRNERSLTKQQRKQQQRQQRRQQQRLERDMEKEREEHQLAQGEKLVTAVVAVASTSPVLSSREADEVQTALGWDLQQLDFVTTSTSPPVSMHQSGHGTAPPVTPMEYSTGGPPGAIGSLSPSTQARSAGGYYSGSFPAEDLNDARKRPPGFGKFMQQGFGNIWSNQYTNQPAFGMDPWAAPPHEEAPTGLRGLQALEFGMPDPLAAFQGVTAAAVEHPCCYCGAEAAIACPMCTQVGLSTYFCSVEHQSLIWEEHLRFHTDATTS